MNGAATAGIVQSWQGLSLVMETSLTAITWAATPLPFKFWSVGCLCMDLFIMVREMILHPTFGRRQQQKVVYQTLPQFNVGMMM